MSENRKLWLGAGFAGLFWGAYEYNKWISCRAGIAMFYEKDVLIAQEPPCNQQHSLYNHRLDCDAVRKDTDVSMFYSNVTQCFFEKHILFTWWGLAIIGLCIAMVLRYTVYSYFKERRRQQKLETLIQLRRFGMWPDFHDTSLLALPENPTQQKIRVPRNSKSKHLF